MKFVILFAFVVGIQGASVRQEQDVFHQLGEMGGKWIGDFLEGLLGKRDLAELETLAYQFEHELKTHLPEIKHVVEETFHLHIPEVVNNVVQTLLHDVHKRNSLKDLGKEQLKALEASLAGAVTNQLTSFAEKGIEKALSGLLSHISFGKRNLLDSLKHLGSSLGHELEKLGKTLLPTLEQGALTALTSGLVGKRDGLTDVEKRNWFTDFTHKLGHELENVGKTLLPVVEQGALTALTGGLVGKRDGLSDLFGNLLKTVEGTLTSELEKGLTNALGHLGKRNGFTDFLKNTVKTVLPTVEQLAVKELTSALAGLGKRESNY